MHAIHVARALDVAARHPLREGADVAHIGLAGGGRATGQPGGEAREVPFGRHAVNGTAPTDGVLGTNVAPRTFGGVRRVLEREDPMVSKFDRRTLLAGGAATAAGFAGASALGGGWDALAGAATNGPGRNGVTKKTPKKGGTLIFRGRRRGAGLRPHPGALRRGRRHVRPHGLRPSDDRHRQRRLGPLFGRVGRAELLVHLLDRHLASQPRLPRRYALQRRRPPDQLRGAIQVGD